MLSGATKLLNPQPQSVSCSLSLTHSLSLYACVAIIHSNGFSNTIYAEREKERERAVAEQNYKTLNVARCAATYWIYSPQLPQLQSSPLSTTSGVRCGAGMWHENHMRTHGGQLNGKARMCSSSLQIKFADKLHLPFAIALSVSISLSFPRPHPIFLLSVFLLFFVLYFHYNFNSKHLRD